MQRVILAGVLMVLAACGGSRPDGEVLEDLVEITATASVDGVPLLSGGATNSIQILVEGAMTTTHGIASSTYSWNGGEPISLELSVDGDFAINLDLVAGEGVLVLEGTPLVEGESSTFEMSFILDQESPTLIPPDSSFAGLITSEGEMDIEKSSTTFTLSGGVAVPVINGVTFAKFSTTFGSDQPNLPVWRYNLTDNLELTDARVEFRLFKDEDMLVDWTVADTGEHSDFEVVASSELHERIGTEQGDFRIETRAFDGANNVSEVASQTWTQSLLSPPVYIATGSEDIMGVPGGALDPRSYTIGTNFSELLTLEGLVIGSVRVGNPSSIPVLVNLLVTEWEPTASYSYARTYTKVEGIDSIAKPPANGRCGSSNQYAAYHPDNSCMGTPPDWGRERRRISVDDLSNEEVVFEVRTQGGEVVSNSGTFTVPPNTEYHVLAKLAFPVGNTMTGLTDEAQIGPYIGSWNTNVTINKISTFFNCILEDPDFPVCRTWELAWDYYTLTQYYASWEFSLRVRSKINLDINETTEWGPGDPDVHLGYSRTHSSADSTHDTPTSLSDLDGF